MAYQWILKMTNFIDLNNVEICSKRFLDFIVEFQQKNILTINEAFSNYIFKFIKYI
jgi:hypothetical protein